MRQRAAIARTRGRFVDRMALRRTSLRVELETVPFVAIEVDEQELAALLENGDVDSVFEDELSRTLSSISWRRTMYFRSDRSDQLSIFRQLSRRPDVAAFDFTISY